MTMKWDGTTPKLITVYICLDCKGRQQRESASGNWSNRVYFTVTQWRCGACLFRRYWKGEDADYSDAVRDQAVANG